MFALSIVRLYTELPKTDEARVLGKQLLRSATSVGAHYREACRSRSDAEFVSKLEGGLQELDETGFWLELLRDTEVVHAAIATSLLQETDELTAIFVASVRTVKRRTRR